MNYWEPKMEEVYWYIDNDSLPYSAIWVKGYIDVWRFNIGNIFRTQEEAILKLDYLKVKNELKKHSSKFEYGKKNYFMFYSNKYSKIMIGCEEYIQRPDIYFESYEEAEKVIKKVGEENILKYYLRVKD